MVKGKNVFKYMILLTLFHVTLLGVQKVNAKQYEPMALINDVAFHNTEYDNGNAGNGFIVSVKGQDYAITAKHILMIVKTDTMKTVDFSGELKQWKMFDRNDASNYLILNRLINTNNNEKLEWESLENDWLVFSIKDNMTQYKPLTFRASPLSKGEALFVVGWAYEDKAGPQRRYQFEYEKTADNVHTLIQVKGPESLAGLSGSPVVDAQNQVVGLVSTGWQDEESNITYLQAGKASDIENFITLHDLKLN